MRRTTPGVEDAHALMEARIRRLSAFEPSHIVRVLEPLVTDGRRARLREVIARRLRSVAVVFDRPYDPHNGAAVIRSCEAFGVQELHVVEREGTPFVVARSVARSAEKWIDVTCHASVGSCLSWAGRASVALVAAHPAGELEPHELALLPRIALVLGNEREGIRKELAAACAHRVRVPMRGFVESLNVSVTGAILLHAATAGRPGDLDPSERERLYARGLCLSVEHAEEILAGELANARGAEDAPARPSERSPALR